MNTNDVINFWFKDLTPEDWFKQSVATDSLIKTRFEDLLEAAKKGELFIWRESALGRLAEIIILDQFSRNIYRGTPKAFEADAIALVLAQEMVKQKFDLELPIEMRSFAYMPYMHSESKLIHEEAVKLFSIKGLEYNLKFEIEHKEIIDRFGRYPHRNKILGRASTEEEIAFLKTHAGF